jgi:hypothetical protein
MTTEDSPSLLILGKLIACSAHRAPEITKCIGKKNPEKQLPSAHVTQIPRSAPQRLTVLIAAWVSSRDILCVLKHILALLLEPLCVGYFQHRVSLTVCSGWLRTKILLISAFWVARVTDMCLAQAYSSVFLQSITHPIPQMKKYGSILCWFLLCFFNLVICLASHSILMWVKHTLYDCTNNSLNQFWLIYVSISTWTSIAVGKIPGIGIAGLKWKW